MEIKVLASGSSGNCYLIDGEERLLLEAGIPIRKIKEGLNFQLSTVAGCLVSHGHMDHAKAAKDLLRSSVDCFMSAETAADLNLNGEHRLRLVEPLKQVEIGKWSILPFQAVHDAPALGYLIAGYGERVLYLTDSAYSPYRFEGLTRILLEVNFDRQTLKENLKRGVIDSHLYQRLLKTHLGLETAVEFFKAQDLSKLREIHILHLSSRNANEERIKKAIQAVTGVPVMIAGGE